MLLIACSKACPSHFVNEKDFCVMAAFYTLLTCAKVARFFAEETIQKCYCDWFLSDNP